ncbi:hypothetical protein CYMTET_8317 [Cymbomonas tetramitiformis]|uniref:Uncharacterized protein n=1 Tax=Cymbomonas tetramitiformis TaxID=36881 RepID=A0AAE0GTY2_9CHLO|nr:hypothetical protein CYMTET_8317 [Cymbomonas tetramitiformis]
MLLEDFCQWQDFVHLPALVLTEEGNVAFCNNASIALIPGLANANVPSQMGLYRRMSHEEELPCCSPTSSNISRAIVSLRTILYKMEDFSLVMSDLSKTSLASKVEPIQLSFRATDDSKVTLLISVGAWEEDGEKRILLTGFHQLNDAEAIATKEVTTGDDSITCSGTHAEDIAETCSGTHAEDIAETCSGTHAEDIAETCSGTHTEDIAETCSGTHTEDIAETCSGTDTEDIAEKPSLGEGRPPSDQLKNHLADVSHEMRTPLNCISGFNQLLLRTDLDLEQRQWLQMSQSSCEQLQCLVNNILDYNLGSAGKMKLELSDFDLQTVFEDTFKLVSTLGTEKNLEFVCFHDRNTSWKVHGDAFRIRQIMLNLLSNSIKFTEKGEVTFRIQLLQTEPEATKRTVRLTIQDTGIGMSEPCVLKLFKRFTKADNNNPHCSSVQRLGSSGLGLAITLQLVELMGGTIEVTSSVGVGSTFAVTLELSPPQNVLESPQQEFCSDHVNFRSAYIILVASNSMLRFLQETLSFWGCTNVSSFSCLKVAMSHVHATNNQTPMIIQSISSMEELVEASKLQKEYGQSVLAGKWVVLTPLDYAGVARGMQDTHWRVLQKPVRDVSLLNCLSYLQRLNDDWMAQKGSILVVEDCPTTQMVVRKILESNGYTVDVAENGVEAMKALYSSPYMLCIVDAAMPVKDGLQTTIQMRELEDAETLPIIAVSISVPSCQLLMDNGANEFFVKPLNKCDLLASVQRLSRLSRRKERSKNSAEHISSRRALDIRRQSWLDTKSGRFLRTEEQISSAFMQNQARSDALAAPTPSRSCSDSLASTWLPCEVSRINDPLSTTYGHDPALMVLPRPTVRMNCLTEVAPPPVNERSPTMTLTSHPLEGDDTEVPTKLELRSSNEGGLSLELPIFRSRSLPCLTSLVEQKSSLMRAISECPHRQGTDFRILAVDDNPVNLKVLLQMLRVLGYKDVVTCNNGKLGVETVSDAYHEGKPFTFIFMDHAMPVMNGFEASSAIISLAESWEVAPKIISLSADSHDSERAVEAGMSSTMSKPITFEKLRTVLSTIN